MKDYYYILGINKDSSSEDIKNAYKKLSLKFNPKQNNGDQFFEERFKEINDAYETLINESDRIIYDLKYESIHNSSKNRGPNTKRKMSIDEKPIPPSISSNNSIKNTLFIILGIIILYFISKVYILSSMNQNVIETINQETQNKDNLSTKVDSAFYNNKTTTLTETSSSSNLKKDSSQSDSLALIDKSNNVDKNIINETTNEDIYEPGYYITNGNESHKVYFYNSPNSFSRRKAYINTQEDVLVQKIINGYGFIDFTNDKGQKSIGWLNMQDLIVKP